MIQASVDNAPDKVPPFHGASTDFMCGNESESDATKFYPAHVALLGYVRQDHDAYEWSEHEFSILYQRNRVFEHLQKRVSRKLHALGMAPHKLHLLYILVDPLRQTGGKRFLQSSLYKVSH